MSREPLALNPQKIRVCKGILLLSPFTLALTCYRDIGLPTSGQTLCVNGPRGRSGEHGTEVRGGRIVAGKMRSHLHQSSICADRKVTASFGVADWTPGQSAGEVFRRADHAMYEGERLGKDRVVVAPGAVGGHAERT